MRIIADAKILANIIQENSSRSGVYFTAYNIITTLHKRHPKVYLYTDIESDYTVRKFFKDYNFICTSSKIFSCFSFLFYTHKTRFQKSTLFSKILTLMLANIKRFYGERKFTCKKDDIYFSPFFPIPKFLQNQNDIHKFLLLHDCIPFLFPSFFKSSKVRGFLLGDCGGGGWFDRLVASFDSKTKYFANSYYTQQDCITHFPILKNASFQVTYLAADKDCFYPDFDQEKNEKIRQKYHIPRDKRYLFSLCTLDPRKNLIFVIENFIAWIQKENIKDMVFVLGGAVHQSFIQTLKSKNLDLDCIIIAGYIQDEDLSNLFSHSFCSIYLSLYEGFGLPPLEAMQCGTPVIASNTTSLPEVVGEAGVLLDPCDHKALQNALSHLYHNESLRKELIQKGFLQAQKFSWNKCVDIMLDAFKESKQSLQTTDNVICSFD